MADTEAPGAEDGLYIDGEFYGEDDLTYGEQRKVRDLIRQANAGDENFDVNDAALIDLVPAIVTVVKQRENPDFSWDDALKVKPKDLRKPITEDDDEAESPPTPEG